MYCTNCGNLLPDEANFCDKCGAKVEATPAVEKQTFQPEPQATKPSPNITLGTDGKYRWYYEFKLMKNPTILKVLWKIFFWICIGLWLFVVIIGKVDGTMNAKDFWEITKVMFLIMIGLEALETLAYFIYAAIQGFKYCVMFEMDDQGVTHTQMPKQFKKAQAMAAIEVLAGIASGDVGATGRGILAGSKSSMKSSWSSVKSIEIQRRHEVITVNERLNKNQVYALPDDFPFVESFIREHVDKKCKIYEK